MKETYFSRICLPYCLQLSPEGTYYVLSREYKPIGFSFTRYVEYEQYPVGIKIKRMTPKVAQKLSARGESNVKKIYLYNDGCPPVNPWGKTDKEVADQYWERLRVLSKMMVEVDDSRE